MMRTTVAVVQAGTEGTGTEATLAKAETRIAECGRRSVKVAVLDEITGGSPYGATTIAGADGSRLPTANELEGARYQGRKIAETASKLHG
jgi:NAD(P)H dehydrogenase (quinone)